MNLIKKLPLLIPLIVNTPDIQAKGHNDFSPQKEIISSTQDAFGTILKNSHKQTYLFSQENTKENPDSLHHAKILNSFCEDILSQYGIKAGIDTIRHHMIIEINAIRKQHGLPELKRNIILDKCAQHHAEDMFNNNYYNHINTNGEIPQKRIKNAGFSGYNVCENIDKSGSTLGRAIERRVQEPAHLKNILIAHITDIGVGFSGGDITKNNMEQRRNFFVMDVGTL